MASIPTRPIGPWKVSGAYILDGQNKRLALLTGPDDSVTGELFANSNDMHDTLTAILARLDMEAKALGELTPFVCNGMREDIRTLLDRIPKHLV